MVGILTCGCNCISLSSPIHHPSSLPSSQQHSSTLHHFPLHPLLHLPSSRHFWALQAVQDCNDAQTNIKNVLDEDDDDQELKKVLEVQPNKADDDVDDDDRELERSGGGGGGVPAMIDEFISGDNSAILSACIVGLFTGISVVFFNIVVHDIRDFSWDGLPGRGASWLREEPLQTKWQRVVLVPTFGGVIVSVLNILRSSLEQPADQRSRSSLNAVLEPILKTIAACVTLGTGNSLGPEGPSVEIGASVGKGVGALLDKGDQRKLSLRAAGSAAGISSGFNAAVAGCFFAVESVLWPSPSDSSLSLTNTTSMVILSAVIASVISEIGLGSEPAFTVPGYDFRSPSELPLYLLLGILCGLVSVSLSRCTSFMLELVANTQKTIGMPKAAFPILGGLTVGLVALAYPEILYWGFENVDTLLESRPWVEGLSVELEIQLVLIKMFTTSLCRASGLVGGYYAPSLFIGAATGMAYGKIMGFVIAQSNPIFHLSILEVASPQAYGLVGMAATLAGVCQVPLTAVLLLFELTQDYRIVIPLLGAVGTSSWITSGQSRRREFSDTKKPNDGDTSASKSGQRISSSARSSENSSNETSLCELESSLCLDDADYDITDLAKFITVSQAMRTKYVTVSMSTALVEALTLMLAEKQSCAVIIDDGTALIGVLTLDDIQLFSKLPSDKTRRYEDIMVSEICASNEKSCQISLSLTPNMSLYTAQTLMDKYGLSQVPVILNDLKDQRGHPVGLLDKECIKVACTLLSLTSTFEKR